MDSIVLSVIMVAEGDCPYLAASLYSVYNALYGMDVEVFIVDGGLPKTERETIAFAYPKARFLESSLGNRAVSLNTAIRKSHGEFVLFLAPSVLVGEETLRRFFFQLDQERNIGAIGLRILDTHGELCRLSKRAFPHLDLLLYRLYGLSDLYPNSKRYGAYFLPDCVADKAYEVDVLSTQYMLVRREALEKAGLFDERLDEWMLDIDLSFRLWQADYRVMYMPERVLCGQSVEKEMTGEDWKRLFEAVKDFYAKNGEAIDGLNRLLISLGLFLYPLRRRLIKSTHRFAPAATRRLLILSVEENFPRLKSLAEEKIPNLRSVSHWNLGEERVMGAISRRNQMKGYTDYLFAVPDVRLDQLFLFMERQPNKSSFYHLYIKAQDRLISFP